MTNGDNLQNFVKNQSNDSLLIAIGTSDRNDLERAFKQSFQGRFNGK